MTEKMHKTLGELFVKGYEVGYKKAKEDFDRPHGEWVYHKEWELDGECAFECSKCGMGIDVDYNFCPNCGADMRTQNDRSWDTSERGVSGSVKNSIAQEEGKEK